MAHTEFILGPRFARSRAMTIAWGLLPRRRRDQPGLVGLLAARKAAAGVLEGIALHHIEDDAGEAVAIGLHRLADRFHRRAVEALDAAAQRIGKHLADKGAAEIILARRHHL